MMLDYAAFPPRHSQSSTDAIGHDHVDFAPHFAWPANAPPRLAAGVYLLAAAAGTAQRCQQSVPIVRDAEIEALVRDYARPILQAAGLSKSGIEHHPGQRPALQRLRRRPPHLHQHRRLLHGRDAERDHRRARPRDRPSRRRPPAASARPAGAGADHGDRRLAARRRRHRGRCGHRQQAGSAQAGTGDRRRRHGSRPPRPARLPAHRRDRRRTAPRSPISSRPGSRRRAC